METTLDQFSTTHLVSALISFIPALINLTICCYVFFKLPRKPLNDVFSLFVFFLFIFQMTDTFMRLSPNAISAQNWLMATGSWIPIAVVLGVHFSLLFTRLIKMSSWVYFILYMPAIIFTTLHMMGFNEVSFIEDKIWGFIPVMLHTTLNNIFSIWISFLGFLMPLFLIHFVIKMHKERKQSMEYKQAILVALGISIPVIQGVITEILFPMVYDINPVPLTSASITIFSVCVFIAITKFKLLLYSPEDISSGILNKIMGGMLIIDKNDTIQFVNQRFSELGGYSSTELVGCNLYELFGGEEQEAAEVLIKEIKASETSQHQLKIKCKNKEGGYCWVEVIFAPYTQDEEISGYVLMFTDIRAKKMMEQKLNEIRQELDFTDIILNNINNYVLAANSIGDIIYASNSVTTQLGYEKQDVLGKGWYSIVGAEESMNRESTPECIQQRATGNILLFPAYETWIVDKRGERRCILWQDTKKNGDILIGIGTDITSKKVMENKMLDAISETQENERKRIARDIHDGLVQVLAGVRIYLNVVESRLNIKNQYFSTAQHLVDQAICDARSLSHDLMPVELGELGLIGAIEKIKDRLCLTKRIELHFEKPVSQIRLSKFVEVNVYRIVQEFLNNTLKYANAKSMTICFLKKEKKLWITLKDDGKGFDMNKKTQVGIGMQNMRTRIEAINGQISTRSMPGQGVLTLLIVPLD